MPSGVYERKPGAKRILSDKTKERCKRRFAEINLLPQTKEAKSRNAYKATSVRVARTILKRCPLGAKPGDVFTIPNGSKAFEVIDPAPMKIARHDGSFFWKQRFTESVQIKIDGAMREVRSVVAVIWDYEPTVENLLRLPLMEERK